MQYLTSGLGSCFKPIIDEVRNGTSLFLNAITELGFREARIGQVVAGIGLIFCGSTILLKTFKARPGVEMKNLSFAQLTLKISRICVGLGVFSLGVYYIMAGLKDLSKTYDISLPHAKNTKSAKDSILKQNCLSQVKLAEQKIFSCPYSQELWEEQEERGFVIECTTPDQAPSGAVVWLEKREILISQTNQEVLESVIFELNNLKHSELVLSQSKYMCLVTVDEYAKSLEEYEYYTAQGTYQIFQQCVSENYWSDQSIQYEEEFSGNSAKANWKTLKGYLKMQEKLGHTDLHRLYWYQTCDQEGLAKWTQANRAKWKKALEKSPRP